MVFLATEGRSESPPGKQLFYRMLGSRTNSPLLPKTRTVWTQEGSERTGSTGMADSGFTEYPFCCGKISYTFVEKYAYFPRIASSLPVAPDRINTGDILIDHVYEPDGCVWGPSGREFIQTFVASGRELVSVSLLVASEPGAFRAALLEGGPDGRWLRFEHRWVARSQQTTVGMGFFRWRDLDLASAYVDHVRVFDLGPAPKTRDDPPVRPRGIPRVVLSGPRVEASERVEAELSAPPGYVITGIGARAAGDNVTTMRIRICPLLTDGTMGAPEEMLGGWELDAGLEANIDLPDGYVATGFGGRIAPEWDVKTFAVWGRPLLPDGTLGDEKEFRAGVEPNGGLERKVRLEEGRVLISAGLRCAFNDVAGISARSARIVRTATSQSDSE